MQVIDIKTFDKAYGYILNEQKPEVGNAHFFKRNKNPDPVIYNYLYTGTVSWQ